jgi:poly(beta-D-mannuronate) lyase
MTPRIVLAAALSLAAPAAFAQECDPAPEPVTTLAFDSRYEAGDDTRSDIDEEAEQAAEDAIGPVDDFLRDLVRAANDVVQDDEDANADCVLAQIATWARADALTDLGSDPARLTIGSRIAGFGLVLQQVLPAATNSDDADVVRDWLAGLVADQIDFWDNDAPPGARQGNLRAWAALGAASVAGITDDSTIRDWSAASITHVLCTVSPDGSIPQEMRRGRLALHYQLHAIAPLVLGSLLLDQQGQPVHDACDGALGRAVLFTAMDIQSGEATKAITGEDQSLFDGSDKIEGFHLAWIEAYLRLPDMPGQADLDRLAEEWRPLGYSKLGGNQTLLWTD